MIKRYYLLITIALCSCKNGQNKETTQAFHQDISEFVYASVNVIPKNIYYSRPSKSGIIKKIFVEKGDRIKIDQSLFSINATADLSNRLKNATVNLEEAKNNLYGTNSKLSNIENKWKIIKEQNIVDSSNYQSRKRLWNKNIGSRNDFDKALLTYQNSTSQLNAVQLEYNQTEALLKNQLIKAQNQVRTEESHLSDLVIKSKINGKVFSLFKEVGEFISPQENFAEIANTDNYIIEMNIDEADISKLSLGDTAIIHLEAYPDTVYTSTLVYISEIKDDATQTFSVEGVFIESPTKLFSGLAGEANILTERRNNALVIPSSYLLDGTKVLTQNGPSKVKIGVKNFEYVEILDGIDKTTVLLKPDSQ